MDLQEHIVNIIDTVGVLVEDKNYILKRKEYDIMFNYPPPTKTLVFVEVGDCKTGNKGCYR